MENEYVDFGPRKKVAKTLAQNLIKDAGISEAPVSLQKIIEFLQKKRAIFIQRANLSDKISGLLIVCEQLDQEYTTIVFNEIHPWCRRRFTIAHEIGHLLLGHTCAPGGNAHNETEANIFAGELLIPTKFIKKDFVKTQNVPELSKLYRVSGEALSIKLMDARLLHYND